MNNKAFTVSLALAGFAVFMIFSYITSKEDEYKKKYGDEVQVLVAKKDIKEMDEIHANVVEAVTKPKQFAEPGRATSKEEVIGFIAALNIRKGEQITLNKVLPPGAKTGLSRQISPGKRALSIPVSDENAVSRLIKPGDRIDIISTMLPPGAPRGSDISKYILQDVLVLAVGEWVTTTAPRKVEKDDVTGKDTVLNLNVVRNYNTITIEVDPAVAQQMALLRSTNSTMTITLRNNDDSERVMIGGTTIVDIIGQDASRIRMPASRQ